MKWGVLIRSPKAEKLLIKDSFKVAKKLAKAAKEKYQDRPEVQVYLYSRTKAFAPPPNFNARVGRHYYWCPYCGKERKFYPNTRWHTRQCRICGITLEDFWVKTYNHLWRMEDTKKKKKKRVRTANEEVD